MSRHLTRVMTIDEADLRILKHANDKGKFAIPLGHSPDEDMQMALERGMDQEWFTLIDISPAAEVSGIGLLRIFRLTDAGKFRLNFLIQQEIASLKSSA